MSFIRSLFVPKIKQPKQDYRFAEQTTKLVGKPLPVLYGRAKLRGNIVYASTTSDLTKSDYIVNLCWGPVIFDPSTCYVNGKRPRVLNGVSVTGVAKEDQIDVKVGTAQGYLHQQPMWIKGGDTIVPPGTDGATPSTPPYGLNRTAYARILGKANENYNGFDQFEIVAARPPLFASTGDSAHYNTPIPPQIAAINPNGFPSSNPIAATLDFLLNPEYGAGKPFEAFGDFATWIAAIGHSGQLLTLPSGLQEPRHAIGLLVGSDESDTNHDIVENMLELGDAKIYESAGIIKVWQPRRGLSPVASLTRDDFDPNGAEYDDLLDRPNIVEVNYDNDDDGEKQSVTWIDQTSLAIRGEIRKTYNYKGISSRTMASRKARLIGRKAIVESMHIEGKAHHRYRRLEPGDLVAVTLGDESGEWLQNRLFWVDKVERINSDSEFGVSLSLVIYGSDALYDDGQASELDRNDPILRSPKSSLPDPRSVPDPVADVAANVTSFVDQDGRITYAVNLSWPEPDGEPHYMHDRYNIYRRIALGDPWVLVGTSGSLAFRDVGSPVYASQVYYAVVAVTSAQTEGALPALFSVKVPKVTGAPPVDSQNITVTAGNRLTASSGLVAYLDVSWTAVTGAVKYQLYYKYNGSSSNIFVDETTGTALRIDNATPGSYLISVVSINAAGVTSDISSTTFVLRDDAYDGPEPPTNLRVQGYPGSVGGQFAGKDIVLIWDAPVTARYANPHFKDYAVEVLIGLNTVAVFYVTLARFVLDYETNWRLNKGLTGNDYPARIVTFRVRTRDRNDRLSSYEQITASNLQAGLPTTVAIDAAFNVVVVKLTPPAGAPDVAGALVAIGNAPDFTPSAYVADIPGALAMTTSFNVEPGSSFWLKFACYDVFGRDSLNWTSAYQVSTEKLVSEQIAEGAIRANNIADDVWDAIESRESRGGVDVVTALPPLPDDRYYIGKFVYLTSDGKLYRNRDNIWTRSVDGNDILANSITTGALNAGIITSDKMAVNAVTARALAIGDFSNIVRDPIFTDQNYWYRDNTGTTAEFLNYSDSRMLANCPASSGVRINANATNGGYSGIWAHVVDVEPGEQYYCSAYVGNGANRRLMYITCWFADASFGSPVTATIPASAQITPAANSWAKIENVVTVPAGMRKMRVFVSTGAGTNTVAAYVTLVRLRKMQGSVLIENGAITADKLVAGAVTTDKLVAGSITGEKLAAATITGDKLAVDSIDANRIRAGTITADKLIVNGITTDRVGNNAISALQYNYLSGLHNESNNATLVDSYNVVPSFTTSAAGQGNLILTLCSRSPDDNHLVLGSAKQNDNYARVYIFNNFGDILWDSGTKHDNTDEVIVTMPRTLVLFNHVTPGVAVAYAIGYSLISNTSSALRKLVIDIKPLSVLVQEVKR